MTDTLYNPQWVRDFYDAYGMQEWERFDRHPMLRIAFAIHRHYLQAYLQPGQRVLEIGAGPGRFTQVLAEMGMRVTVADISPGQLALNRQQAAEHGFAHAVDDWVECDACDLREHFVDETFDAVVAYGGLLSYVFDQAGTALTELRRVVTPGGPIFLEVMSLWGAVHCYLPSVLTIDPVVNRQIVARGDLDERLGIQLNHHCRMYRAGALRRVIEENDLAIEVMTASNVLSTNWEEQLRDIVEDSDTWQHLLEMELEACREPGCLDMGTHLIAVCRKEQ
jgi:ubiquinone/menaquinone biosynthesis C-methylase UbiE